MRDENDTSEDASTAQPVHCVTCCQSLPAGQKHPEFFGQAILTPDPTAVHDVHAELASILDHIATVSHALLELHETDDQEHDSLGLGLSQLLQELTGEANRRALALRNAGLYWQCEERNDGSLFPDLQPPAKRR